MVFFFLLELHIDVEDECERFPKRPVENCEDVASDSYGGVGWVIRKPTRNVRGGAACRDVVVDDRAVNRLTPAEERVNLKAVLSVSSRRPAVSTCKKKSLSSKVMPTKRSCSAEPPPFFFLDHFQFVVLVINDKNALW